MHFGQLIIINQRFEVDPRTLLIAIVLDLSRDIKERQVEFREGLVFESYF